MLKYSTNCYLISRVCGEYNIVVEVKEDIIQVRRKAINLSIYSYKTEIDRMVETNKSRQTEISGVLSLLAFRGYGRISGESMEGIRQPKYVCAGSVDDHNELPILCSRFGSEHRLFEVRRNVKEGKQWRKERCTQQKKGTQTGKNNGTETRGGQPVTEKVLQIVKVA